MKTKKYKCVKSGIDLTIGKVYDVDLYTEILLSDDVGDTRSWRYISILFEELEYPVNLPPVQTQPTESPYTEIQGMIQSVRDKGYELFVSFIGEYIEVSFEDLLFKCVDEDDLDQVLGSIELITNYGTRESKFE